MTADTEARLMRAADDAMQQLGEATDHIARIEQELSDARTMLTATAEAAATHLNRATQLEQVAREARDMIAADVLKPKCPADQLVARIDELLEPKL